MRIAVFSPLPPLRSGIADYSAELLPHLVAAGADVELFVARGYQPDPVLTGHYPTHLIRNAPAQIGRFDARLYHMGNDIRFHEEIYESLLRWPGVVVLHEFVLHHSFAELTFSRGDRQRYEHTLRAHYGEVGAEVARRMAGGQSVDLFSYPLCEPVLDASLGVIVHSEYTARRVRRLRPGLPVAVVPHHLSLPNWVDELDRKSLRDEYGLSDQFVVGSFGYAGTTKRLDIAMRAFRRFLEAYPDSIYILVGGITEGYDLRHSIESAGLDNRHVRHVGFADLDDFFRYMCVVDVALNLRYPAGGEMSGALIRLLGMGVPTLVSDSGPFAELPDDVVARVQVGDEEEDQILAYLEAFADHPSLRQALGENARAYARQTHSLETSARKYLQFLKQVMVQSAPPAGPARPCDPLIDQLVGFVTQQLADWGVTEEDDRLLAEVARAISVTWE